MDVRAHLLPSFSGSKDSDDGDLRPRCLLYISIAPGQLRVEIEGRCLVVVDTIESDSKEVHGEWQGIDLWEQGGL